MAAEHDQFEEVDWSELGRGGLFTPTLRSVGFGVVIAAIAAAIVYQKVFATGPYPLIHEVDVGFTTVTWEITNSDWLFMVTIVAMVFYGIWPMAARPRLAAEYWKNFRKNRAAVVSAVFLVASFVVGLVGPLFLPYPDVNILAANQPPIYTSVSNSLTTGCLGDTANGMCYGTWAHPLGTMGNGKDVLLYVVYGMKVSMEVGLCASLIVAVLGTFVGTLSAYAGGLVDELLMRYVDLQLTFPTFFLYLLVIYTIGGSLFVLILIFGFFSWGATSRLVRAQALQLNEEEYIQASNSAGGSWLYVIRRHFVPNVSSLVITNVTLLIPGFILAEAALAFLGLGGTYASWGKIISAGRGSISDAWWISTIPGVFLFLTILAFSFMGDALNDALDPRRD